MKVYGYTEKKDVVEVDLSIDDVVDNCIDPWRLDLFDPSPLVAGRGRNKLYFRRLTDVVIAYVEPTERLSVIAVDDGETQTCVSSKSDFGLESIRYFCAYRVSCSQRSFAEHLREYLRLYSEEGPGWWLPVPSENLQIRADEVRVLNSKIDAVHRPGSVVFIGEMLNEVTLPARLDKQVNWVLKLLARWKPMVVGEAVRRSLWRHKLETVRIVVNNDVLQRVERALTREHGISCHSLGTGYNIQWPNGKGYTSRAVAIDSEFEFEVDGCIYRVAGLESRLSRHAGAFKSLAERFIVFNEESAECVYATAPNLVTASRLALYDIGKRQSRRMAGNGESSGCTESERNLKSEGFRLFG